MDKKNDHSCKHSQRDSFIEARAANHCYAFHISPIQTNSRRAVTRFGALLFEPVQARRRYLFVGDRARLSGAGRAAKPIREPWRFGHMLSRHEPWPAADL